MEESVTFASGPWFMGLAALLVARGLDFLSTWIATPGLLLEANPIARRLGWGWGLLLNVGLCVGFAFWPLPAVVITTTSLLVAARNFQSAWVMRTMGEQAYGDWIGAVTRAAPWGLQGACLWAQALIHAALGATLLAFGQAHVIPFGMGMGLVTYATAVLVYTGITARRRRRH